MEWQWSNSEALDLVREGIVDGQFEILGSTLAQNIIYSIPSLVDNEVQIELHRKMLKDVLGVEPVGFLECGTGVGPEPHRPDCKVRLHLYFCGNTHPCPERTAVW